MWASRSWAWPVEIRPDVALEDRHQVLRQCGSPRHPLEVVTFAVVVRAVEARSRNPGMQPAEQRLVADVHAKGDLRLPAIAAEVALADQDPDDQALVAREEVEREAPGQCASAAGGAVSPGRNT